MVVVVEDLPPTENRQSPDGSFFTTISELEMETGLQMPISSSWACWRRRATCKQGVANSQEINDCTNTPDSNERIVNYPSFESGVLEQGNV